MTLSVNLKNVNNENSKNNEEYSADRNVCSVCNRSM